MVQLSGPIQGQNAVSAKKSSAASLRKFGSFEATKIYGKPEHRARLPEHRAHVRCLIRQKVSTGLQTRLGANPVFAPSKTSDYKEAHTLTQFEYHHSSIAPSFSDSSLENCQTIKGPTPAELLSNGTSGSSSSARAFKLWT
jgi:hypothetical protein